MSDDASNPTNPRSPNIDAATEPSVQSLIPPQTIDWVTSIVRTLLTDRRGGEPPLDVSVALVEADVSLGEKVGFGALPVVAGEFRSARPKAYALLPLGPIAESSTLSLSSPTGRGFYLSIEVGGNHRWTDHELAGMRLAATLLAREVILRREVIGLRYKQSDWEARRLFDATTGLAGRDLFIERLEGAVRKAARYPDFHFAVLQLEIDQLEAVHQGLGREVAEDLVRAVAERIQPMVRLEELLARSPSEGFLILLEHVRDPLGATRVALRIQDALAKPVTAGEREMRVSASVGIVLSSAGLDSADRIVALAGVARGRAQELGLGEFQIFEPQMQERVRARLDREAELRRAVEREEFEVFYQPLIDLQSGHVAELEALVRWNHPQRGRLSAGEFIPLAEETDLILSLGWWVIATACPQMREWQHRFVRSPSLTLTVNVSARHLALQDFVDRMSGIVAASGIDPRSLHLEITESVLIRNPNDVRTKLRELRAGGMSVYLDDFGTGYSSLRYLSDLPLDGIKLDGSFVERITTVHTPAPIARTVRQLARDINVRAIAEGIETEAQLDVLRALGYDRGQGFHIARPLSVSGVEGLLAGAGAGVGPS